MSVARSVPANSNRLFWGICFPCDFSFSSMTQEQQKEMGVGCSSRTLWFCVCSAGTVPPVPAFSWAPWSTVEPFCQHLHRSLCWSWLSAGSFPSFFGQSASESLTTLSEEKLGLSTDLGVDNICGCSRVGSSGSAHEDFGNSV